METHPDLFGGETAIMVGVETRPDGRAKRKDPKPRGYAMRPGTGPAGETCGTCRHHVIHRHAKAYHKCDLARAIWTGGRASDILVRSPACSSWKPSQG